MKNNMHFTCKENDVYRMLNKKVLDNRKKNTKRKISRETAEEVMNRDKGCIVDGALIQEIHHAYYWNEAEYSEDRNDANKLVWLCRKCHDMIHSRWWNEYREYCKNYLKTYYGNNT